MTAKFSTCASVLAGALLVAGCGSSPLGSSPLGPSGMRGSLADSASSAFPSAGNVIIGGQTCRVYPTSSTTTTTGSTTGTSSQTCTHNGAGQVSCTTSDTDSTGATSTTVSTADYASINDIVDEVQVVPPLTKVQMITSNITSAAGSGTVTVNYAYDGLGKVTQMTVATVAGALTTTYTAWDPVGRPTAGTSTVPGVPFDNSVSIVYDDGARTATTTIANFAGQGVNTLTFDPDGILVSTSVTGLGQSMTTTTTVLATGTICK